MSTEQMENMPEGCHLGRESARSRIKQTILYLREKADELQALLDALPDDLPLKADSALWSMAIRSDSRFSG